MKRMFQFEKSLSLFFFSFSFFFVVSSSSYLYSASGFYIENGLLAASPQLGACTGLYNCAAAPPSASRRVAWVVMAEASGCFCLTIVQNKEPTKPFPVFLFLGES